MKNVFLTLSLVSLSILGSAIAVRTASAQTVTRTRAELPASITYQVETVCIHYAPDGTPTATFSVTSSTGAETTLQATLTGARANAARQLADIGVRRALAMPDAGNL
jgi:hypothetical protein